MDVQAATDQLEKFFGTGQGKVYEKNATIIHFGEEPKYIYWIKEGIVKVITYTCAGNEHVHYLYKARELFPVTWIINAEQSDIAVAAFTKTQVIAKTLEEARNFLNGSPITLLTVVNQQLDAYARLLDLNISEAEKRIASLLLILAKRFGKEEGERTVIELPFTIQEFADNVRLSRETTGKILNQFERQGLIIVGRQNIVIYVDKLKSVVDM